MQPARYSLCAAPTRDTGVLVSLGLKQTPGMYVATYRHFPKTLPVCRIVLPLSLTQLIASG